MFVVKELAGAKYHVANDVLRASFASDASGDGLIALPPVGWKPESLYTRSVTLLPTSDFRRVRQLATVDKPGFVVVEPSQGWQRIDEPASGEPLPSTYEDEVSPWTMIAVAAALGLVAWVMWA